MRLYKLCFREQRSDSEFLSLKTYYSSLEKTSSLNYTTARWRLKILVDLSGILAWWKLEELVYGWLGRANIRFCSSCAFGCLLSV